ERREPTRTDGPQLAEPESIEPARDAATERAGDDGEGIELARDGATERAADDGDGIEPARDGATAQSASAETSFAAIDAGAIDASARQAVPAIRDGVPSATITDDDTAPLA